MKYLLFIVFILILVGNNLAVFAQSSGLEIGDKAPEIALSTPLGQTVTLSSLKGRLVLIDFWATWCAP